MVLMIAASDNCASVPNSGQENADNDAFGDLCDSSEDCGADSDGDRIGDALLEACDNCPGSV
jgi:hypothetical protein